MRGLFLILLVIFLYAAPAEATFTSGNDLLEKCNSKDFMDKMFCLGYAVAVADTMDGWSVNGVRACVPKGATQGQVRDVVVDYISKNAATRHQAADWLVTRALTEAFPCR